MPEVTSIPSKAIRRQPQKPTSPQDGLLWYDTQAEVLKQFKNGSFQNVGVSPDELTVRINDNGKLERFKSRVKEIYGDFEEDTGAWTINEKTGDFSMTQSDARSTRGSHYLEITGIQAGPPGGERAGKGTVSRNLDIPKDGIVRLDFYSNGSHKANPTDEFRVLLDGNVIADKQSISTGFNSIEVRNPPTGSNIPITVELDSGYVYGGSPSVLAGIDNVRVISVEKDTPITNESRIKQGAGN